MDPSEVTLLGRVHKESSADSTPASKKKKADPFPTPKASSKKNSSSKSRSDDIKDLDEKWRTFCQIGGYAGVQDIYGSCESCTESPFSGYQLSALFDPGTSTTGLSSGVTVGGTGSSLDQTTAEAAVMREAVNKSATRPVEGPGTDVKQQNATQPFEAPCARMATQPVEAPGAGPEVLLSGAGETALQSDSDYDLQSEPGSPVDVNDWSGSPDRDFNREDTGDQDLSEDASYRETIRGVRSFMVWHDIPEFDRVSSSDDNPFAGSRVQPAGKVSIKLPVDEWLCRKMEKLNLTITEGYPSRNTETAGLLRDKFIKPPRSSKWYDMHTNKKDSDFSTVFAWSQEQAKLNSAFSRVARRSLLVAPPSRTFSQEILRRWERASREQTIMCNQAAGLSRCLTKVQDAMSSQLKNLTLIRARARDLSEGVFISMAHFTLARRDSYLEYLHAGVKQDTLTALRTSPIHLHSLFPDNLLIKAEEEVSRSEERRSAGQSHRKPGRFHSYASNDKSSHQPDRKPSVPAWKQIRECQQGKKGRGKPSTFSQKPAKGSKPRK